MGIHDRDYYRGATGGSLLLSGASPMVVRIIIANVIVVVLQLLITRPVEPHEYGQYGIEPAQAAEYVRRYHPVESVVQEWLELDTSDVLHGQIWRLVTYAFCHATTTPWHILFNMLLLWWFGRALEAMYGSREFLGFYLTGALIAGAADVLLCLVLGESHRTIGASGAVMGVFVLYALYYPTDRIYIFFVFPVEIRWLLVFYIIFDLFPVLQALGGGGIGDGIAHAAHLGGAAYGFLYKRYDLRFVQRMSGWNFGRMWRDTRRRRQVKLFTPVDEPKFEEQIDAILQKITAQGEASLTDRERELLKEASRRFKNR